VGHICVEDAYQFAIGCNNTIVVCGVYSPMKHYQMDVVGKHFGVVDLGGLGHMAIKFGKTFGMTMIVFSTSPSKEKEVLEVLRANQFIVSKDQEQMKVIFFLKTQKSLLMNNGQSPFCWPKLCQWMLDTNVTEFMICVHDMLAVVVLSIHASHHPSHHPSIQVPHPGRKR
jgi:hypothetical protein